MGVAGVRNAEYGSRLVELVVGVCGNVFGVVIKGTRRPCIVPLVDIRMVVLSSTIFKQRRAAFIESHDYKTHEPCE